jgi:hypothetical protein
MSPLTVENNMPICIRSERLTVEIAEPDSVYNGTRFDWTGFITQVELDKKHTFCVPESYTPGEGTGGWGICNEFGNEKAVGYEDARPGEPFPKLGIGLLKRPNSAPYNFLRLHEIVQHFPIEVQTSEAEARFVVEPLDCRGYAARLIKTVGVHDNWLEIAYKLENVGTRPIDTHEYAHNFIGIDKNLLGPDYCLRLPYPIRLENLAGAFRKMAPPILRLLPGFLLDRLIARIALPGMKVVQIEGNEIGFRATPSKPLYCRPLGFSKTDSFQWEITHRSSGVGLREYDDFNPSRVVVWGTTHVLSAEIYVDIRLQPGETQTWLRRYEFFTKLAPC